MLCSALHLSASGREKNAHMSVGLWEVRRVHIGHILHMTWESAGGRGPVIFTCGSTVRDPGPIPGGTQRSSMPAYPSSKSQTRGCAVARAWC